MKDADTFFMKRALELAGRGEGLVSPNPMVGAVLVKDDRVIGEGFHLYERLKHAESYALESAGESARGATLYCSLEPCCHDGRTSPCTDAIIEAGIARVVVAMNDPDVRVNGKGIAQLAAAGIDVEVGLCGEEAGRQNECYMKYIRTGLPFLHLILPPSTEGEWAPSQEILKTLRKYDALVLADGGSHGELMIDSVGSQHKHRSVEVVIGNGEAHQSPDGRFSSNVGLLNIGDVALPEISRRLKDRGVTSAAIVGASVLSQASDLELVDKVTLVCSHRSYSKMSGAEGSMFHVQGRKVSLDDAHTVTGADAIEITGYPRSDEAGSTRLIKPKKSLGQHFLVGGRIARRIVDSVAPTAQDAIIEIGPGEGVLTSLILESCGYLVCVEIDGTLVERLRASITAENVNIIEADALKVDWSRLISDAGKEWAKCTGGGPTGPRVRLVANLPYYISTPLIQLLIQQPIVEMTLMLQEEVVDRIVAGPGGREYGYLSVLVQYHCETRKLFGVAPSAFRPPPKVRSAVMRLVRRTTPVVAIRDERRFFALVRAAFAQRRKTIYNNLKAAGSALGGASLEPDLFVKANIDPKRRAETLSIVEYASLDRALFE